VWIDMAKNAGRTAAEPQPFTTIILNKVVLI
jgi:hypothetical protein